MVEIKKLPEADEILELPISYEEKGKVIGREEGRQIGREEGRLEEKRGFFEERMNQLLE